MVVVRPWKLPDATMISAESNATPLTSYAHLRATLMADSTASAPVFIVSTISVPVSSASSWQNVAELVVVEGARREGQPVELLVRSLEQRGMAVTEVQGGVSGQEVEVPLAVDVGDPGPFGLGDHDRKGVVVVGAPLLVEGDEVA